MVVDLWCLEIVFQCDSNKQFKQYWHHRSCLQILIECFKSLREGAFTFFFLFAYCIASFFVVHLIWFVLGTLFYFSSS
ncbi:hypothetical protein CsatA_028513 [Cannabis sativa]